jgi:Uma2 family endonuclease
VSGAPPEKYASLPVLEPHEVVQGCVLQALIPYVFGNGSRKHEHGLAMRENMAYVVSGNNTLVPDVSVFQRNRLKSRKQTCLTGAPELAIEVVSPTELEIDLKRKISAYLEGGSKSVSVVYPEARSLMIYTSDSVRELKDSQSLEDPLLPGFSSPVSAFFELT